MLGCQPLRSVGRALLVPNGKGRLLLSRRLELDSCTRRFACAATLLEESETRTQLDGVDETRLGRTPHSCMYLLLDHDVVLDATYWTASEICVGLICIWVSQAKSFKRGTLKTLG